MKFRKVLKNGAAAAVAETGRDERIITGAQSALDLALKAQHDCGTDRIAVPKEAVAGDFFILSTGLAGEVLQKLVNYHFRIAFFGDFSRCLGGPLRDFMRESNRGRDVFFVQTEEEAVEALTRARP